MQATVLVLLGVLVTALGAAPAAAQVMSCVIAGEYAAAAALHLADGEAQLTGRLTFTPPGACAPGGAGSAQVALTVLVSGNTTPL